MHQSGLRYLKPPVVGESDERFQCELWTLETQTFNVYALLLA